MHAPVWFNPLLCTLCLTGRDPEQKTLEAMVKESPGPLNFTMFLSLFGDKLKGKIISIKTSQNFIVLRKVFDVIQNMFYSVLILTQVMKS